MGHFQQTLSATGGGALAAPFPHLLAHSPTASGSPASEVSNLRRQRVLEGLPEPINSFMCNVQWPEGVTYKKVRVWTRARARARVCVCVCVVAHVSLVRSL
jgi:hypothetical protein